jgi:hypothetical protein
MAKTWVLQTETKGTGATMVPLERAEKRTSGGEPVFVPRQTPASQTQAEPAASPARVPRRFRIVDVMTRRTLLEDGAAAEAVEALRDVRSTVDVVVHVWDEGGSRWRPLTQAEQRAVFDVSRQLGGSGRSTGAPSHMS